MTGVAACPACVAGAPAAEAARGRADAVPTHRLVLPEIHCAACIRTVEEVLAAQPGVAAARVNLSRHEAVIRADPGADPTPWIEALAAAGHVAYEATDAPAPEGPDRLVVRLGVAGFAMMNVMLLSVAVWSGAEAATRDLFHWISAAIALPATVFSAEPFFTSAGRALRAGRLNMDVPISVAIALACAISLYETWAGGAEAYFDAALSLTFFLLAGRVLEGRMRRAARSAAGQLAALEPARVLRLAPDGTRESRRLSEVAVGDRLWLTAGARVPVDGVLEDGPVEIDRSALTGESDPVPAKPGAALRAGETLLTGPATLRATAVGEDTTLRRMARLAAVAEGARGRYTSLADKAARIYAPGVHGLALVAFAGWAWATGDIRLALNVAIATLIITCPCALGLAVPAVATAATGRLFRRGVLVTSETALERLAEVDTVLFDKTGTLTRASLTVPADLTATEAGILKGLAAASDHPLARAVLRQLDHATPAPLSDIAEETGRGVAARHGDTPVWFGQEGEGTVLRIGDRTIPLPRTEELLPGAAEAVAALRRRGLAVHLLTGDREARAAEAAARLNPDAVHAGVDPEGKHALVRALQADGARVLMVGDGLNDTAALAEAWASMAPRGALEASRAAADAILLAGDVREVPATLSTARTARARILQNFAIAAGYNAVAIPLAVAGYASPLAAALAMSLSSISVTLNALRPEPRP